MTSRPTRVSLALVAAAISAPVVWAGPNAGGTLVVHDTGTNSSCEMQSGDPASCEQIDNELPAGPPPICNFYYWKVYAAFPPGSSPRLKAMSMGAVFGADVFVVHGGPPDPGQDLEVPDAGWPTMSGTGVGISYGFPKTAALNDCYWFVGYGYSGTWSLAPHPTHGAAFVDDSSPPIEDPIAALGSIGFGQPGETPCPVSPEPVGACCFYPDCSCQVLTEAECADQGGVFLLEGVSCDPNPCSCPPVYGACCLADCACQFVSEAACSAQGGAWIGPSVFCEPNPCSCPPGACCFLDGSCQYVSPPECATLGGEFAGFLPCDPDPCATPSEPSTWGRVKERYRN